MRHLLHAASAVAGSNRSPKVLRKAFFVLAIAVLLLELLTNVRCNQDCIPRLLRNKATKEHELSGVKRGMHATLTSLIVASVALYVRQPVCVQLSFAGRIPQRWNGSTRSESKDARRLI